MKTINEEKLLALKSLERPGNENFLADLIALYLRVLPENLSTITAALKTADRDQLRKATHSLKSSSAALGAEALHELCAVVEMEALTSSPEKLRALCLELIQSANVVAHELKEFSSGFRAA